MISQANIGPATPMGATLIAGGATFRVWAPAATAVYLNGTFAGTDVWTKDASAGQLMVRQDDGRWTGFVAGANSGDEYKYYVVGTGSVGYKRDPYARELSTDPAYPSCNCVLRPSGADFPWTDGAFATPDFSNMILYQLHVGVFNSAAGQVGTFLDVALKAGYLAALGINVLQPLPIDECKTLPTEGYNGTDYFSPDMPYVVPAANLGPYVAAINVLRAAKGAAALSTVNVAAAPDQLRALIDLCHLYGIAVVFDVVYNHAGGFEGDDESLFFWDRQPAGDNNNSQYFTDVGYVGGLSFALWNADVRGFLIDSARYYADEFHIDGIRYDQVSDLIANGGQGGLEFARDVSGTMRFLHPRWVQNAEYWPVNPNAVASSSSGGDGFDVTQHDALRIAIRGAISQASYGAPAPVNMTAIAQALYPPWFPHGWQAVPCVENHDIVRVGAQPRIPALADGSSHRSWYARSRSRVAMSLLLTAPGIPQIFMGQEFLEDKQWSEDEKAPNRISWDVLDSGDTSMSDFLRFTQDAIRLRWQQPALRGDFVNAFHVHDQNRIVAFQRLDYAGGADVIVVASLNDSTYYGYEIGFPSDGTWLEVFNSDVYDNWVNPVVAGNGGSVLADASRPMHGFAASASIVIPANGVIAFARGAPAGPLTGKGTQHA
jgi:1,4-alpha-glucan branching enzyme